MKLVAGAASDVGQVRERNEDSFLIDDRLPLFAVADGMGGHRGGAVASSTSLEALRAAVAAGEEISAAIQRSNSAVYDASIDDPDLAGMGTTLTAVVALSGSSLLIGHVGDSRAYLVRDSQLAQITEDHSLVEELVREGRLTREQAEVHPQRSIITRALGVEPTVEVDVLTLEVRDGDRLLLCSDGLTSMLRDRELVEIMLAHNDPRRAADQLVDAANAAGGEDNITVLVLNVLESDAETSPVVTDFASITSTARETIVRDTPAAPATPSAGVADLPTTPDEPRDPEVLTGTTASARWRSFLIVAVPLVLVVLLAFAVLGWYARRSYYVGLDRGEVVVFKGVPGGVLWWDPTVETQTGLTVDDLSAADEAMLAEGAAEGSRARAEEYVELLRTRLADASTTTTAPTTTSPRTTTAPTTPTSPTTIPGPTSTVSPPPATAVPSRAA